MPRVLLVTDQRQYLAELGELFREKATVTVLPTVEAALSAVENSEYDITFLPLTDGKNMDTILELSRRKPGVTVVYSDQSEPAAAVRAIRLGANEYIDARRTSPRTVAEQLETLSAGSPIAHLTESFEEQQRLQHEARQFRMLFDNMLTGFAYHRIILDEAGKPVDFVFLEANPAFEEMTGLLREEILEKPISETQPGFKPHDSEWTRLYGEVALTGKAVHFERYSENLGRWLEVSAYSPEHLHFATVFQDITERKEQEREMRSSIVQKTTLLREIHHRVKNNMQVIASLLNLQLGQEGASPASALERSQERIYSMALIHELLYRSSDLNEVELTDYARQIGSSMVQGEEPEVILQVEGSPISIAGEQAFSVGLMVTEAISNALTHGRSGEQDRIILRLEQEEQEIIVTVEDQGPGFSPDRDITPESLGFTLIREMAAQLNGSVSVDSGGRGTRVIIRFPRSA